MSFRTEKADGHQWKDQNGRVLRQLDSNGNRQYRRKFISYDEQFLRCPAINADIAPALSGNDAADAAEILVLNQANKDFEVLGTNMTSALSTFAGKFDPGGGIKLTTAGADADFSVLLPHLDTKQTGWAAAGNFMTQKSARFEACMCSAPAALITTAALTSNVVTLTLDVAHGIPTGAVCTIVLDKADSDYDANMALLEGTFTVTAASSTTLTYPLTHANISSASIAGSATPAIHYKQIMYAGLKKTNVETITTDTDQAYFRASTLNSSYPTYWHFISSRGNTDVDDPLPVLWTPGSMYHFVIELDDARRPHIFINGEDLTASLSDAGRAALATDVRLIPYVGNYASGTTPTAKAITVQFESAGQLCVA